MKIIKTETSVTNKDGETLFHKVDDQVIIDKTAFWHTNLILSTYVGSTAHGTFIEGKSDVDVRGICIPPVDHIIGLHSFRQWEDPNSDTTIYGLSRFIELALQSNPNILEIMFADDKHIIEMTEYGKSLRDIRDLFLCNRIINTYGGSAREGVYKLTRINKDKASQKRIDMFDMYQFDVKEASHMIRLLRTATHALLTGKLIIELEDTQLLRDIRLGAYTLDEFMKLYEQEEAKFRDAKVNSVLANKPNIKKINTWLMDVHSDFIINKM